MEKTSATQTNVDSGMNYFLEDVAQYLYNYQKGNLINTLVIFPNRRARLFFNKYLSMVSNNPVWAPQYLTISDLIQQLGNKQLADPLTLIFKLFKIFREISGTNESFDSFYFYCEIILADFDDIDKYLVNADDLFQNLSDLKSIDDNFSYLNDDQVAAIQKFWDAFNFNRPSDAKEKFKTIWEVLRSLYHKFNQALDLEGIAYEGKLYRSAIEQIKQIKEPLYKGKTLAFVGFNALNHSEEIIFDHFNKAGNALFFWDYDESFLKGEVQGAGFFLRKYLRKFSPPSGFKSRSFLTAQGRKITVIATPNVISQGKLIEVALNKAGIPITEKMENTAIVLGDESLLLPVVSSIPTTIKNINISLGYPVNSTPAYSFINALKELHLGRKNNSDGTFKYYHRHYITIMQHNFMLPIYKTTEFQIFMRNCVESNTIYISPNDFITDNKFYNQLFTLPEKLDEFGTYLLTVLQLAGKNLMENEEASKQQELQLEILNTLYRSVKRFSAMLKNAEIELSIRTLFGLINQILGGLSVPFTGEPLKGLQIMGILETRTLDFENLIILSVNEGKLPKATSAPSLIPFSLRSGFELPTSTHQDAIYAYYFYRLLQRSKNVVLLYNTFSDGLQKGEASRFIQQLVYNSNFEVEVVNAGYEIFGIPEPIIKAKNKLNTNILNQKYLISNGSQSLSPSALNTFLTCKLKFYFQYIEGLKELDQINEDIESDVFGKILHKSMQLIYNDFIGKSILPEDIQNILDTPDRIATIVQQAFHTEYFKNVPVASITGNNLIIEKVLIKYITEIVRKDQANLPINLISLEEEFKTKIIPDKLTVPVYIGGRVDRLENKGSFVKLVDYKTGKADSKFNSLEELFDTSVKDRNSAAFQAFVYCWILLQKNPDWEIQPSLFFVRNISTDKFTDSLICGDGKTGVPVHNFSEYAVEFEIRLKALLGEIFSDSIIYDQTLDNEHCKNCAYKQICKR